ncbi:hypothetical protein [Haloplanus aerogenes]|uniref:Uncharacterized protein n=1 Tax=Haloplanus aerogenes TaxID=660522 RepID=A0A3M0DT72_9EURY|nr:hypothetical protein [Haloplanus aerogenes]AZH25470.1 hypothetical protein DU502_08790 [Haloplanus aerogenes]RMB25182.1 hypothetical protein ATH50_0266 [Haloplanus aerogenes]
MSERIKPLQFTWLKRAVVLAEVVLGSLLLAWVTALIFQSIVAGPSATGAELADLTRTFGLMLLMGTILFLDGLRRGRRWM